MEKVGIAISTFNRPDILDLSLYFFKKYTNLNNRIIVYDDGSFNNELNKNICDKYGVEYFYHQNRGIAKTKNKCIEKIDDCDHLFLFDDDVFPIKQNWENIYIDLNKNTNNHHFLLMYDNSNHSYIGEGKKIENNLSIYQACGGVLFYITKEVLKVCGGYLKDFSFYGHEHTEFSYRINKAGLTPSGYFLSPTNAKEYFYILDYGIDINNIIFKDINKDILINFSSSILNETKKQESLEFNLKFLYKEKNIYQNYK
jgi:GT2 family glycosyltransferase